jgi:hypothetical protein
MLIGKWCQWVRRNEVETGKLAKPVTIDKGPADWQILQQDANGVASVALSGRWETILKRKQVEVRVRVCREGTTAPINKRFDWVLAHTVCDRSMKGELAGRRGRWSITLVDIPRGGPYRIETRIGAAQDDIEWRRAGAMVNLVGVGDVWLIAGQSNAEGYGRDPVDDPPEIGVHQFVDGRWSIGVHQANHSPWLAFAKRLKAECGYPIGLIPTAVGGSAISRWVPGRQGDLFVNMKRCVQQSGGQIKGCVWYQGESDTALDLFPKYKGRFTRFLNGLRRLVKDANLPIITVQLNRVLWNRSDWSGWEAIREAQRQLTHELPSVFIIPIFEAGLCDGIHISALGNLLVARRAAETALGAVYGCMIDYLHPECSVIKRIGKRTLELRFDHVVGRLDYQGYFHHDCPFAVRDDQGEVPILGYKMRGKKAMRLALGRALEGGATVTGAPGCCPPQNVPKDVSGYRGMLGFTLACDTV